LEERGFIRRLPNRARALEVLKLPDGVAVLPPRVDPVATRPSPATLPLAANDVIEVPLHGRIAAGVPIEALEGTNSLSVPAALLGSGEHYALEVAGDSMVEAGILDGDFALIQRTETARDGQIVVALVDESDATLKYFRREGSRIRLDPANGAYEPQVYEANRVRIQGKLAGLLRRYN
jgi:repressor LexA